MDELKPCPYTDEEVSQKLRKWKGHCQIPGLDELILWAADIIDRRPAPQNKALTLEQLRQMDGEPVWAVFEGNVDWPPKAHWCFVRATKCILQVYPCAVHQAKNWLYTEQDFNRGVANAYARKPELEEK
ncbi:hypothetical protein [Caproiciproducens sp.]